MPGQGESVVDVGFGGGWLQVLVVFLSACVAAVWLLTVRHSRVIA